MKIKTFPIQFIDTELEKIKNVAKSKGMTLKDFILEAIEEKVQKENCENE